jgi:hypothetical protein
MQMKLLTRNFSFLTIATLALLFSNCGGDSKEKAPEEIELGKLSKTWSISSATLDNAPRTADFANFKLTISGAFNANSPDGPYDYDVTGSRPTPSPWPDAANGNGGTWTFAGTPTTDSGLIARDDGTAMTYSISGGSLTLTFNFNGTGYQGARSAQVNGDWVFVFN